MSKHPRERDVPHTRKRPLLDGAGIHPERRRSAAEFGARDKSSKEWLGVDKGKARTGVAKRVPMEGGKSFPARSLREGDAPRRPPICMLFDDLDHDPPSAVFGMYPRALIAKVLPWLRCERREVLHVCSGGLPKGEGIRVDIRPEARPDVIADGRALPFADGTIKAVMIDPPYTEHYARELYGVEYPLPSHLLREACRVVRPGGRFALVHYLVANPPDGAHHVKTFGLSMGFGYPMRAVTIYEREQAHLFPGGSAR